MRYEQTTAGNLDNVFEISEKFQVMGNSPFGVVVILWLPKTTTNSNPILVVPLDGYNKEVELVDIMVLVKKDQKIYEINHRQYTQVVDDCKFVDEITLEELKFFVELDRIQR
jgi:hypothetical protein